MDTLLIHVLNSLLYAAVLFLIAGGLSLIYGVMHIVNLAHGNLYAFGAFVAAWAVGLLVGGATQTPLLSLVLIAGPVGDQHEVEERRWSRAAHEQPHGPSRHEGT